ncbi:MAG: hypothetical protein K2Q20_08270, partial [Phycisphaerales bacterium]|nr:hypothetical protein [Phycisphaerales bacterium]
FCGECGAPMTAGSVVCVRCGHNTQTGKSLRTAVVKVKEEKSAPAARRRQGRSAVSDPGPSFAVIFLGCLALLGGLAGGALFVPSLMPVAIGLCALAAFIGYIGCLIAAFREDATMYAILGIVGLVVPLVGLAFLYYVIMHTESRVSKALYLSSSLVFIGVIVAAVVMGSPVL